jgi:hypothetical protein
MTRFKDLTGCRFGLLSVIAPAPMPNRVRWICRCDCGTEKIVSGSNIRRQISCGCAGSRTTIGDRAKKHGHSIGHKKSRTATAWRNAKTRCFNTKNAKYPSYGGRGITMCEEWARDFRAFLRDMGECPDDLTLERIDVNGNYEPRNCVWISKPLQAKNRRSNVKVNGLTLTDYAANAGVPYRNLRRRIINGETPEQAVRWLIAKRRHSEQNKRPTRQN